MEPGSEDELRHVSEILRGILRDSNDQLGDDPDLSKSVLEFDPPLKKDIHKPKLVQGLRAITTHFMGWETEHELKDVEIQVRRKARDFFSPISETGRESEAEAERFLLGGGKGYLEQKYVFEYEKLPGFICLGSRPEQKFPAFDSSHQLRFVAALGQAVLELDADLMAWSKDPSVVELTPLLTSEFLQLLDRGTTTANPVFILQDTNATLASALITVTASATTLEEAIDISHQVVHQRSQAGYFYIDHLADSTPGFWPALRSSGCIPIALRAGNTRLPLVRPNGPEVLEPTFVDVLKRITDGTPGGGYQGGCPVRPDRPYQDSVIQQYGTLFLELLQRKLDQFER